MEVEIQQSGKEIVPQQQNSLSQGTKFELKDSPSKKHKNNNKKIFPYGNYNRYYGYRSEKGIIDTRINALRREWFESKNCLDIGCNVGKFTFDMAYKFRPVKMLGIDIDENLIKEEKDEAKKQEEEKKKAFPISFKIVQGPLPETTNPFPNNVSFISGNYLNYEGTEKYDCITCLSTSKWIHLNWGDNGIKALFSKVYEQLNEGGVFVFEPQLWSSYKRKGTLTENIKKNIKEIQLRPEKFQEYLTTELKFTLERTLQNPEKAKETSGFDRPILLLRK